MHKILYFLFVIPFSVFAQWTQVSSLPSTFQTHHSFGFAINNTGYLVSGEVQDQFGSPQFVDEFYSYTPSTDTWTQLDDFPGSKRGFAIGDVWNDKAYFGFGLSINATSGAEIYNNDLWVFDPTTSSWTELTSCPCQPRIHPTFVSHQGKIYLGMGGTQFGNLDDWWAYDIATDTWDQKADFPSFERHHPYHFSIGDYVYSGFGHGSLGDQIYDAWYRYDPSNDTWLEVESLPAEGRVAGTQFSHDGFGYVLSGDGDDHSSMVEGEFWRYDETTDNWLQLPSHPGNSRWAPASFVLEDHIYIINGTSFGSYIEEVYKFDLANEPVGVNELDNNLIKISPNPFKNVITLENNSSEFNIDNTFIQIVNALGVIVVENKQTNSSKLDLSKLDNGVYFLNLYSENELISKQKIVKE